MEANHQSECSHPGCSEYRALSRRGFLARSAAVAAAASAPAWLPRVAMASSFSSGRDVFVSVFLRGGFDGLTAVPPYGDPFLYDPVTGRPSLGIQPPGQPNGALDLDGFFGLAPAAAPLLTPWGEQKLAIVHAAGSPDPTRSHFDAMAFMEHGTPLQPLGTVSSGWLARHLQGVAPVQSGPLRGMAVDPLVPRSLAKAPKTLPVPNPGNFGFPGNPLTEPFRRVAIEGMYSDEPAPLGAAALNTIGTIDMLELIDFQNYLPSNGAVYPLSVFGQKLRSTAALIKADVGVEAISADIGGWDLHNALGPITGDMAQLLNDLTLSLEAFYLDMKTSSRSYVLVAKSEFGRRVMENASAGTDHGHGNAMLVMGDAVVGGQVYANWPGLDPGSLVQGDLDITTDYRDVLAEILQVRMNNTDLGFVFPNYSPVFQGIVV